MYFKTDRYFYQKGMELFGEIQPSGEFYGSAFIAKSSSEMVFCENTINKVNNGFLMEKDNDDFILGKHKNSVIEGPVLQREDNVLDFKIINQGDYDLRIILDSNAFAIHYFSGNVLELLDYRENRLVYGYAGNDRKLHSKVICENINLNLNFNKNYYKLNDINLGTDIYSASSTDSKICRKKYSSSFPNGYGFVKWEGNELCISEFYYDDRHGLGCYRWHNGDEYYGQFKFNKVDGLGVFSRNGMYELGVFTNKIKNGVFFDITNNTIWIRRYTNGTKQIEEFRLDLNTFDLSYVTSNGSLKKYTFKDTI